MSGNGSRAVSPQPENATIPANRPPAAEPAPAILPEGPRPFVVHRTDPTKTFSRVPTHAVGMAVERRQQARAGLRLPLRLTQVNNQAEPVPVTLLTRNISSSGVFFLAPRQLEPGMKIELEVALIERPVGRGGVRMATVAHVVRVEASAEPGWHGIAATFDDFAFRRDEAVPTRYNKA